MATKQPAPKEKQPATSKEKQSPVSNKQSTIQLPFVFDKTNYVIMVAGLVIILIGFLLMGGGATHDPNVFPKEEIYSFRRITLAPIVIVIGFGIEIFAILKKPKAQ